MAALTDDEKYANRIRKQIKACVPHYTVAYNNLFSDMVVGMGLKKNDDPYGGDNTGAFLTMSPQPFILDRLKSFTVNVDPAMWMRSYSANTYYSQGITLRILQYDFYSLFLESLT